LKSFPFVILRGQLNKKIYHCEMRRFCNEKCEKLDLRIVTFIS